MSRPIIDLRQLLSSLDLLLFEVYWSSALWGFCLWSFEFLNKLFRFWSFLSSLIYPFLGVFSSRIDLSDFTFLWCCLSVDWFSQSLELSSMLSFTLEFLRFDFFFTISVLVFFHFISRFSFKFLERNLSIWISCSDHSKS